MFELGMFVVAIGMALGIAYRYGRSVGGIVVNSPVTRQERDQEVLKILSTRPGARVSQVSRVTRKPEPLFTADAYAGHLQRLNVLRSLLENETLGSSALRARWSTRLQGLVDQLEDLTRSGLEPDQGSSDDLRFQRLVRETNALTEEISETDPSTIVANAS